MAIVRDFKIGLIMLDFISIRLAKCETLAKYCNHKHCRWLSGDPALNEYMAGTSAGEGGIYNTVNLSVYHYAGIGQRSDSELQANNPVKYTEPDGREIDVSAIGPNNKKTLLAEINKYSYLQFTIKGDRLILDKSSINSKGSKTFSHDLVDAISDKTNIKIMLVKNTTDEYGNKKIIDGGYTTYDSEKKEVSIAINPQTAYYTDADSGDIRQTSACVVLIHELSGHLLPQIHKENGNAVEKENKIRQEIGLPLRKEDKTHVCF